MSQTTRRLGGFADNSPPLSKGDWMRYWAESDAYVGDLFQKAGLSQAAKSRARRSKGHASPKKRLTKT